MNRSRILAAGLAVAGLFAIGGCDSDDSSASGGTPTPTLSAAERILGMGLLPPDSAESGVGVLAAEDMPPGDAHATARLAGDDLPPT